VGCRHFAKQAVVAHHLVLVGLFPQSHR
jgi:hypothetical protein